MTCPDARAFAFTARRSRDTALAVWLAALVGCSGTPHDRPEPGVADAAPGPDGIAYPDATPQAAFDLQFIDPDYGSFSGGTEVTVRGNGFTEDVTVYVGGRMVEPLDLEYVDSRRLTIRTPPGEPGLADVEVRLGTQSAALPGAFTYEAIEVTPRFGATAGGTFVTVTGFDTGFDAGTVVTFDGVPLTGVTVVNANAVTGYTPPGVSGDADVTAITGAAVYEARRAFTYQSIVDPFHGGMGGGPIDGVVNIAVIDSRTGNGVDGAYVCVGDPLTSELQGRADHLGQITFSQPGLRGPITVTAAQLGYETQQFVQYDARDLTIFLNGPPPPPNPGPPPPGRLPATITGHVLFGGPTGLGSPEWSLVPEPRTPTEVKRIYVTTTAANPYSRPYPPDAPIDFDPSEGKIAWSYSVTTRASAMAVVAIAGLYDPAKDPSGTGVTGFEPFAMGVARGVFGGPGEVVTGVDVVIDIPLDGALAVQLEAPPALLTAGYAGPTKYRISAFLDFGGEGVIAMNKNGLPRPPYPEEEPNVYAFADGADSIVLSGIAPLSGKVNDASYTVIVGAYTGDGGLPYSARAVRGIQNIAAPVVVDDFLGVPRATDPMPMGEAVPYRLGFTPEGPPVAEASFNVHLVRHFATGAQLYRVFTRGDLHAIELPRLDHLGFPEIPGGEQLGWTFYRLAVPGATFDQFNYGMLSITRWSAYAVEATQVHFPTIHD